MESMGMEPLGCIEGWMGGGSSHLAGEGLDPCGSRGLEKAMWGCASGK